MIPSQKKKHFDERNEEVKVVYSKPRPHERVAADNGEDHSKNGITTEQPHSYLETIPVYASVKKKSGAKKEGDASPEVQKQLSTLEKSNSDDLAYADVEEEIEPSD